MHVILIFDFLIITHNATLTYLKSETPEVPFDRSGKKKTLHTPTRLRKQLAGVSSHLITYNNNIFQQQGLSLDFSVEVGAQRLHKELLST